MTTYEHMVIDVCIKLLRLEGVNSKKIVIEKLQELYDEATIDDGLNDQFIHDIEQKILNKVKEVKS